MNWFGSFAKVAASVAVVLSLGVSSASAAPSTYEIDAVHSTVIFRIHHAKAGYSYGRFNEMSGSVVYDDANPAASSVKVEVKTTSVDTANTGRDDHLRGPDFLDCAQFPTMAFVSTSVKANGGKLDVTGNLTFHGVTKAITVPMEMTGKVDDDGRGLARIGFEGVFTIKRTDYGMNKKLEGAGDEVRLIVSFEATRNK